MATSAPEPARRISEVVAGSDLSFLFARLTVDGIEGGRLDPRSPDFAATLSLPVVELLTRAAGREEAPRPELLQALAFAPDPGLPVGDVWWTLALAMAKPDEAPRPTPDEAEVPRWAGIEAQLRSLTHFRRFVIEDRLEGETVYRWFHPAIRDALRREADGVHSERFRRGVGALLDLRDARADDWETPERVGCFLVAALPRMLIEAADEQLFARALEGVPERVGSRLIVDLCQRVTEGRSRWGASEPAEWAVTATRGRADGLEAMATVAQVASIAALASPEEQYREPTPQSESVHRLVGAIAEIERILGREPNRIDLLVAGVRGCRALALTHGGKTGDSEYCLPWINRIMQRVAAAEPPARAAVGPAVAELLESYSDSLDKMVSPRIQAETAGASADLRGLLMSAGRADLLIPYARSLSHEWRASESLGDPGFLSRFHDSLLSILATGATDPDWMEETMPLVGELSQGLTFAGRGIEALEILDRTVTAGESELENGYPEILFGRALADVLALRSSVNAGLGESEQALADGMRALEIASLPMGAPPSSRPPGWRRLPIIEANLAMRVAEGRLAGVPKALNFAGPLLFSRTPFDAENWASDFLMVRMELAEGRPQPAARRAAETLLVINPGTPGPPPRPDPQTFVTFGVELQLGLALRAAYEMLEDPERAQAALPWATTIFLRNQIEAAPTRLLHLEPNLREQTTETMKALISELDEFGHRGYDWLRFLESGEAEGRYVNALGADDLGTVESRYLQPSFALGPRDDAGWPRREVGAVAGSLIATLGPLRRAEASDERPESFS